jgi:hypothetical protein
VGAGAQQVGFGAQQVGFGAQQVGFGAQQVGAVSQQPLPWWLNSPLRWPRQRSRKLGLPQESQQSPTAPQEPPQEPPQDADE